MSTKAWYKADKGKVHQRLHETVHSIRTDQTTYREDVRHFRRLYYNYQVSATSNGFYVQQGRLRYNLTAAVVDTAASLLCANRPVPMYQTTLGDWNLQRKAKRKGQIVSAQFYDLGVFDKGPQVIYNGLITGTGVLRGYVDPATGLPALEVVRPLGLVVDHDEGLSGNPRSLYLIHTVSREVLQALYPSHAADLEKSNGPDSTDRNDFILRGDSMTSDQVLIVEAWHLPSVVGYDDGRHCITASNVTLIDEEYTRDRFPVAVYKGWRPRDGFYGLGLVERVAPEQGRINDLISHIRDLQDLGSNAFVALEADSDLEPEQLTNRPMAVYRYRNTPPSFQVFNAVPPELTQEVDRIADRVMFVEGLTQASVEGSKSAGVTSAVAIRATDDIQSRRQLLPIREVEKFYLQVAQLICDLNDEAAAKNPDHRVAARERRARTTFLKTSRWKDLEIDDGDIRMSIFPISSLPSTPAGKWSASSEWQAQGWIDKGFALELMQFPDLDAFAELENADLDLVCTDLESILDGEQQVFPDPHQDVFQAAKVAKSYYLRAKLHKAAPEVLKGLRQYMQRCNQLQKAQQPPQAPQVMGPQPTAQTPLTPGSLAQLVPGQPT